MTHGKKQSKKLKQKKHISNTFECNPFMTSPRRDLGKAIHDGTEGIILERLEKTLKDK